MIIDKANIGNELKRWFSISVIPFDTIDFNDTVVFDEALDIFKTDFRRYFEQSEFTFDLLHSRAELQGILLYRIAHAYFLRDHEIIAQKYSLLGRFLSGFEIYYSAQIGKGFKIHHGVGMVIGARSVIGDNALFHQGVTLGDRNSGRPILKNNVIVYAGAKILGNITIHDNATIAANCVCLIDVPEKSTAIGVPARIIQK